jgi:hypothetical protein
MAPQRLDAFTDFSEVLSNHASSLRESIQALVHEIIKGRDEVFPILTPVSKDVDDSTVAKDARAAIEACMHINDQLVQKRKLDALRQLSRFTQAEWKWHSGHAA